MNDKEQALLKTLLTERRVLSLGVVVERVPYTGLLPFAMQPDFSAALVHASRLAKHSAGLTEGAPVSFLIHEIDSANADPLQLPRVILQGTARPLDKVSPHYAVARDAYLSKFPASEMIFSLADFNLYALIPEAGRFVVGFGRALNITGEMLEEIAQS